MNRLDESFLRPPPPVLQAVKALAYSRALRNRRPVFALTQTLERVADGTWRAHRDWRGVGDAVIAWETVVWAAGLRSARAEMVTLAEHSAADIEGRRCRTSLTSHHTGPAGRERLLDVPHAPLTLGSLPLFAAQAWADLSQGRSVPASYLVLKVQRSASIRLVRLAGTTGECIVSVTPVNPVLRALFGSTRLVFDADAPRLRRLEGLLDPRDLRPNGRWHEVLGTIEFETPFDLTALADAAERDAGRSPGAVR